MTERNDLQRKLANDIYAEVGADHESVKDALAYLMRHGWIRTPREAELAARGEADGLTITESVADELYSKAIDLGSREWAEALRESCITVVPDQDPELTITRDEFDLAVSRASSLAGDFTTPSVMCAIFAIQVGITVTDSGPEPTIPVPSEPGVRFIAYSPKWCDDAGDQREFMVTSGYVVDLSNGALFKRDVFERDWTVTALVKTGGDDAESREAAKARSDAGWEINIDRQGGA